MSSLIMLARCVVALYSRGLGEDVDMRAGLIVPEHFLQSPNATASCADQGISPVFSVHGFRRSLYIFFKGVTEISLRFSRSSRFFETLERKH